MSVAIIGPPNAGKSSLLNALLAEDRALVSHLPGTTRDTIEESITVHGVQVRLIDTAGIREHADRLEAAGIERTRRVLASSRLALVVLDGSVPLGADAHALLEETASRPRVVFANKADLGAEGARQLRETPHIAGSVRDEQTLHAIRSAIAGAGWDDDLPDLERPHLAGLAQLDAVREAIEALGRTHATISGGEPLDLITADLQRAFAALGQVSGDVASEELLTGIFARFCIGK